MKIFICLLHNKKYIKFPNKTENEFHRNQKIPFKNAS